jgi:predicted 3-demethylubiquinone-9 3-methyltransferase (glyoxalase superfamily)
MKLATCLWFDQVAREAAEYYVSIFPESKIGENWITPTQTPGNEADSEVTVNFEIFGMPFIALNGGPEFKFSEAVSFQIPCRNQEDIDHYWNKLISDGGEESWCGWLKDKYGLSWQVTSDEMEKYIAGEDKAGAKRATEAMLEMRKIDLAALKSAYENS